MLFIYWVFFATYALALSPRGLLLPPSLDSFYKPPAGFEKAKLGEILKSRKTPAPIRNIILKVNIENAWQILVRSEDSFGNPNAVVATILQPHNADPKKLVVYSIAEDSASIDCSPSYAIQNGGGPFNLGNQAEMYLIETVLDKGYYVVAPDYEGPKSVYVGGVQAAHGVLNSIRGALNSASWSGLDPKAKTILWGYSGGSLASAWAAAYHPTYAPDLNDNLIGAAYGGWVADPKATLLNLNGGIGSGLVAAGIAGLSNEYPDMKAALKTEMFPLKYAYFQLAYTACVPIVATLFPLTNFFSGLGRYVIKGEAVLDQEPIKSVIANNTLGNDLYRLPSIPQFIYHGKIDELVPFPPAEKLYNQWCDAGAKSIEFNVDDTAGHITGIASGSGGALGWIEKIFNNGTAVDGCVRTDRLTNLLIPGTVPGIADVITSLLKTFFGGDIGPNGENIDLKPDGKWSLYPNATSSN